MYELIQVNDEIILWIFVYCYNLIVDIYWKLLHDKFNESVVGLLCLYIVK